VIRKCLAKNPDRRWQTAADLRDELEWIASGAAARVPVAVPRHRRAAIWLTAAAALFALLAGWLAWRDWSRPAEQSLWNLSVSPPAETVFAFDTPQAGFAVSPDGRKLVFPVLMPKRVATLAS